MEKIVIGLVGEAAAGKGTVASFLTEKYGASIHTFSSSMKECVKRLHLPVNRENLSAFSTLTRQAFGEDLYARVVAKDCETDDHPFIVVDGIRLEADMTVLKGFPGFHLIYVTAPVELRWQRARGRGEKEGEAEMSLDEFKEQEKLPTETAIKAIGANAEFTVENTGSFDELYTSITSVIEYVKAGDFDHPHPHRGRLHPDA